MSDVITAVALEEIASNLEYDQTPELQKALYVLLESAGFIQNSPFQEDETAKPLVFEFMLDNYIYNVSILRFENSREPLRRKLSPREMEIALLIAKGMPTKSIAVVLHLSPCTVSTYTKRIFLKLNVNSRTEMVFILIRAGMFNSGLLDKT
jgi:DNA-binding NarL/FixJ family response regulator